MTLLEVASFSVVIITLIETAARIVFILPFGFIIGFVLDWNVFKVVILTTVVSAINIGRSVITIKEIATSRSTIRFVEA